MEANTTTNKTLRPCIEESKDWDNTENLYIEGDNLEVLKLLQNSYFNKVKMIYIDPPYNTGKDFIYRDKFSQNIDEYEEAKGSFDEEGNRLFKNIETNGRFHSNWCSMIYPRLILARNLLTDDGIICVQIDDNEYDIIHCHTPVGGFVARLANKNSIHYKTTKMIYTAHGFHFFKGNNPVKNFVFRTIEKYAAKYTDILIKRK